MKYYQNKYLLIPLVLLGLTILSLSIFFSHQSKKIEPKTILVETAPVKEKVFADQFETLGSLASTDNIDISSELAGQIAAIHFIPGADVETGTLLIQLDDTVLKSELSSAKANFDLSEANHKRICELAKRHLVSQQAEDQAEADLLEKRNLLKAKQAQLEKLSLRAPFSGTLGSRQVSVGQYVKVGQPLVHLVANQKLRVEYNLPERYLTRLHEGQEIEVRSDAFPRRIYKALVNYIDPSIDKETRTIAVEALIDNQDRSLSAGLFVRVIHQFGEKKKRLLIPEESLIPTINGQKVFLVRNQRAVAVPVKIGAHHAAMIEISKGLKADDLVIIRGQHKLKEGSSVRIKAHG